MFSSRMEIVSVRIYERRPAVIRRMAWRSPEKPRGVFSHGGGTSRQTDIGYHCAAGSVDEDHKPGEQHKFDSDEEDKAPRWLGNRQVPHWMPAEVGQKRKASPGAEEYSDGVILGKRINYKVFRAILVPLLAHEKGLSVENIVETIAKSSEVVISNVSNKEAAADENAAAATSATE